jgi:GNAT superfamily N-acetyltransferase
MVGGTLLFSIDKIYQQNWDNFRRVKIFEPKFLSASYKELFPLVELKKILEEEGIEANFSIKGKIEEKEINLTLYLGDIRLLAIKLEKENSVEFLVKELPPELPEIFKETLINEDTTITYETASRLPQHQQNPVISEELAYDPAARQHLYGTSFMKVKYKNLNWFAEIEDFLVNRTYMGRGIGTTWYQKHIEPYLKKCGFNVTAILGKCMELQEVRDFWRKMGFSEPIILNDLRGESEEVIYYLSIKKE